ncbi:hypothetical protein EON79_21990 [bacterium]|nr:MAG: hypothetical protein EON79_21990 [bacterium]
MPPPPAGLVANYVRGDIGAVDRASGTVSQSMQVQLVNGTGTEFEEVEVELITKGLSPAYRERAVLKGGFEDMMQVHKGTLLPMEISGSLEVPGHIPLDQWRYGRELRVRVVGAKPVARAFDPKNADSVWSLIRRAKAPEFAAQLRAHPEMARVRTAEGITPTLMACAQLDPGVLNAVLAAGGSLKDRTRDGFGALHFAAISGGSAMVERLLKAGLSPAAKGRDEQTPLHVAVCTKNLDAARALIAHGAPLEVRDHQGYTPLMLTPSKGSLPMAELLIAKGANLRAAAPEGDTFMASSATYGATDFLETGLRHGLKIDERDPKRGITPLHMAAKYGRAEMVGWLLDHGANPELRSSNGNRPIDLFYRYDSNLTDRRMMERAFAEHTQP